MNIKKLYFSELRLALITFAVFILALSKMNNPAADNWFILIVHLIMLWSIYYFTFIRLAKDYRLDERENSIFIKTSHLSGFVFMSVLLILFFNQQNNVPVVNVEFQYLWGWFLLPTYILFHGLTGLALTYLSEK